MLSKNWIQEIYQLWNIKFIDNIHDLPDDVLWTTRCSRTKTGSIKDIPRNFYVSKTNNQFYDYVEGHDFRYAILSDKYGLHFEDEELEYYDIHPGQLSQQDKKTLGELIRTKALERGYSKIVFFNSSPIMSKPYFEMLYYSGLEIYYVTRLLPIEFLFF